MGFNMQARPWISGPKELLDHGLEHLKGETDFDRRMALICIDNSVELMIKTFLSLPKRTSGVHIPRKRIEEASMSFPSLLDALEEFAEKRLEGIDLSDVEWFHRLRNELYHAGNGLTVEKQEVEVYAQIALKLHPNLFHEPVSDTAINTAIGAFISMWTELEKLFLDYGPRPSSKSSHGFTHLQVMQTWLGSDYEDLRKFRNNLVHGTTVFSPQEVTAARTKLERLLKIAKDKLQSKRPAV
jgi:hypothetical protein